MLTIGAGAAVWALALTAFGGFRVNILGVTLRSNNPERVYLIALLALAGYFLAGGRVRRQTVARTAQPFARGARGLIDVVARRPALLAAAFAAGLTITAAAGSTRIAGGSDVYGYVSQADLWLSGSPFIRQPWVAQAPWPEAEWTFAPLGYRPHPSERGTIVPTYSPGLPFLLATAKAMGGQCALFGVVPLLAGLGVLATFGIGSRLGSPWAGVIGGLLVATSPAVLVVSFEALTDVPVMSAWALAFYLLLVSTDALRASRGRGLAFAAGLTTGLAILIRPNLVLLTIPMGLWFFLRRTAPHGGRLPSAACFALGVLPGVLAVAAINDALYGSPATSGYGSFEEQFAWAHVAGNAARYLAWFTQAQTPVALAGLAALLLPVRRIWPELKDRRILGIIAAFVTILWLQYFAYLEFDSWSYLRFLLPSWPFLMIGLGAIVLAGTSTLPLPPAARAIAATTLAVVLAAWTVGIASRSEVFGQRRAAEHEAPLGQLVRQHTADNSVVIAFERSGSLRYYAGRTTLRYDFLPPDWLDRAVEWLTSRGAHVYAVLDANHLEQVRTRFAGQRTLDALERPVFVYEPNRTALYDLSSPPGPEHTLLLIERAPAGRPACDPPSDGAPLVLR
jgi:hypothetical protein